MADLPCRFLRKEDELPYPAPVTAGANPTYRQQQDTGIACMISKVNAPYPDFE